MILDVLEVDLAASESASGSILSGQSALVSSHQLHSERKRKETWYFLAFKAAAGNLDCSESQNLQLGDLLMIAKASKKDA